MRLLILAVPYFVCDGQNAQPALPTFGHGRLDFGANTLIHEATK